MVKNPLVKDIFREIKGTFSRFISIFVIVALGVVFLAGLKTSAPDMEITADSYFDSQKLMDVHIISTLGLTDEDVAAHTALDFVSAGEGAYTLDAMVYGSDSEWVIKLHSLTDSGINSPLLLQGRMPENSGECLTEQRLMTNLGISLGDTVSVSPGSDYADYLTVDNFTVVGIVESPYYISYTRGSSTVGDGSVDSFIYAPKSAFSSDYYTDMFLLIDGAAELNCYDDEYSRYIDDVTKLLEPVGETCSAQRYDDIVTQANEELNQGSAELEKAQTEAQAQLDSAKAELDSAKAELEDGQARLSEKEAELQQGLRDAQIQVNNGEYKISDAQEQIKQGYDQLYEGIDQLNTAQRESETELAEAEAQLSQAEAEYAENEAALEEAQEQLEIAARLMESLDEAGADAESIASMTEQYEKDSAIIQAGREALSLARTELDEKHTELSAAKGEALLTLAQKRQEADDALALLKEKEAELESAKSELDELKNQLKQKENDGRKALDEASAELDAGWEEYNGSLEQYEASLEEFEDTFAEKRLEIEDARSEIAKIEKGQWYILDRDTNPGYVGYGQDADRIAALSSVLPIIFFIVAALVCLTTMTRMVEEHRTQIGAVKAMGYSDRAASAKYVVYALSASLLGSVVGLLVGCNLIPRVIFAAYDLLYDLPELKVPFYPGYSFISAAAAIACTVGATIAAIYTATREMPASLMRPRAPAPGKRVFLEKIGFIWNHMGFIHKVSVRNLLRYKKRFFMTVIGIGGCTALIITGFGLSDSIFAITGRQFEDIFNFDLQVELDSDLPRSRLDEAMDFMTQSPEVETVAEGRIMTVSVESATRTESAYEFVPFDADGFNTLFSIREMDSKEPLELGNEGIIIDQKLSELLNVSVGDTVTLSDTVRAEAKVAGINEQYAFHYIYMTPEYYEQLFGQEPELNVAFASISNGSEAGISGFASDLMKLPAVKACVNYRTTAAKFSETMSVINMAVTVIIVSAALLAFVVLYNLSNINITERIRELATIKVLGFYDMEVSWYVYRENIVLTILGILLGLVLGSGLSQWMIRTIEVDLVMFGRQAEPDSYIKAVVLTIVFAVIVNFVTHFRLKKIPMVESLKTVE